MLRGQQSGVSQDEMDAAMASLSAASQTAMQALIWRSTQTTNASGIATFATPAGQFSVAPKISLTCETPLASGSVYNVQMNGSVVESGGVGSRVYTISAKVNRSTAVVVLAVSVLGVDTSPSGVPVTCLAIAS